MTILNANADIALNAVSPAATVSDSTIKAPLVNQPPAPIPSSKVTLPSSGMTLTPEQLSNNNAYLASHGYGPDGKALPGSAVSSNTTDANRPSSSSSVITNNNTSSTISRTLGTNPTSTGPSKSASDLATSLSSQGINVDSSSIQSYIDNGYTPSEAVQLAIQISGVNDAKKSADAAAAHEQTIYQQTLASQNAQYGQASAKLASDRKNNLDTATAQLASLNSSGGISSDSSQFLSHINAQYDLAQQQLDLQAEQAKAALAAGDTQAYNAIQTNMANTISQVKTNITNLLSGIQSTKTAAAQNATAEQDKAVSAYQSNLVNLPQPQDLAALPATYGSLTSAQKTQLESTTAYQQGIKAGYTPQSILTDIQSAATSAYKKQAADTATQNANTRLQDEQLKLIASQQKTQELQNTALESGNSAITTTTGFKYVDGTQFYGNSAKNVARSAAQAVGAAFLDKNGVDAVHNIESVRSQLSMLKNDLSGNLGSDSWDRLITAPTNLAKKLSESDANLSSLNVYKDTAIKFLQAVAGGSGSGLRINQAEIDNQIKNLPSANDTVETANAKMTKMLDFLSNKEKLLFPNQKSTSSANNSNATSTSASDTALMNAFFSNMNNTK